MTDWNQYLGSDVGPEEYKAQGGTEETLVRDLTELWGDPKQGNDYMSPDEIQQVARKLAEYADL